MKVPGCRAGVQSRAIELSMLLTIPATIALVVVAKPVMTVLFEGGRFTEADAAMSGLVLSLLAVGLPAYVAIKVLAPGFFARKDMKTPAIITMVTLAIGVGLNFALIDEMGITILPMSTALSAWLNAIALYVFLHARGRRWYQQRAGNLQDPRLRRHVATGRRGIVS